MKNLRWLTVCLLALGLLAGCGSSGPKRSLDDPDNSLIFGYVDMSEAPSKAEFFELRRVAPGSGSANIEVTKGLFSSALIPSGSYQFANFTKFGFSTRVYTFPMQNNPYSLRIDKPGIYFLGSLKYKKINTGIFEKGKFSFEVSNTPSEATLLQRLLDEDSDLRNSTWGNKIRARLAELK
jgi:hypothetical protein